MRSRRKARLVDVALDAGVSPATVSRALSQPELLAAETLERVRSSARRLGYLPDAAARALASGRTMSVGAVVPTLDNPIFSRALQSMQSTLAAEGFQLLVASHDFSANAETEAVRLLLSRGVDGLMLVGAERALETEALIAASRVPVVLTWRAGPGRAGVTVDNERAGALAVRHLIELGHRRIAMITGHRQFNDRQRARLEGARATLADSGLTLPDWLVLEQPVTLAGGRTGCATLLELADPPTAIVCGLDVIAIGCMVEAQTRGMGVPDSLSVVGIDDLDMSAHVSPSLTTVHIPTASIGAEAARKLIGLVRGGAVGPPLDLPVELVVRRSSAAPQRAVVKTRTGNR